MNSGFFYSSAEQRERLVRAERQVTDDRVQKVIDLKNKVLPACPRLHPRLLCSMHTATYLERRQKS